MISKSLESLLICYLSVIISSTLFAQSQPDFVKVSPLNNVSYPMTKSVYSGAEHGNAVVNRAASTQNPIVHSSNGVVLGTTTYDLQSNSAVDNRFVRSNDGSMSAVWTFSLDGSLSAPDRGTGHVFFDGNSWTSAPSARIESERGGWPSIAHLFNGGEYNVLHNTTSAVLTQNLRSVRGSVPWNESNVSSVDLVWNRMVSGGPDGNSIHMIAVTSPTALGGSLYNGQDGALLYYRSLDGGVTFDQQGVTIPGLGASFYTGFGGDNYAITSRDSIVAIAVFEGWQDLSLIKSTDNGLSWTLTKVIDFPIELFQPDAQLIDFDSNGLADTLNTNDGTGSILIDANGMVHISYGFMRVIDEDLFDGGTNFFPGSNGLMYWNESLGEYQDNGSTDDWWNRTNSFMIAAAEDLNVNGFIDVVDPNNIPLYYSSLSSHSNMSLGDDGDIYVTYSAHMETLDNTAQNYRHVHVVKSTDGGCSWTIPFDLTPQDDFAECMFASVVNYTTDSLRLIYQEDFEPGLAVRGDNDPFDINEMVYIATPTASFDSQPFGVCNAKITGFTEFCSGDSVLLTASCGSSYVWSTGETSFSIYANAYQTYTVTITTPCGDVVQNLTTGAPTVSPVVTVGSSGIEACPTDTNTVWADPVASASYLWNTGDTTQIISVIGTGTFTVTVSNCGGSGTNSITINAPASPVASISGSTSVCGNDSVVLVAGSGIGYVYSWDNGSTLQSVQVPVGSYTVTVTNCSGSDFTSFTITNPSLPITAISNFGQNAFCEGNGTVNLQAAGASTYLWSNGSTFSSISLTQTNEAGSYYAIGYNQCGDSDTSSTYNVIINSIPGTPVISVSGITYTSSSASGNQWYLNGFAQPGETSQDFMPNCSSVIGSSISVIVTDSLGCTSQVSSSVVADSSACLMGSVAVVDSIFCVGECNGSVMVSASGSGTPYTYLWDDPLSQTTASATGLCSGIYSNTVTDVYGQQMIQSVTINQPSSGMSLTSSFSNPSCGQNNGIATVSVSGGTTPYSYLWNDANSQTSNIAVGLVAGTFICTVTDAQGCTITETLVLSNPGSPTLTAGITDVSCFGNADGSILLSLTGGQSPFTYSWSNGQTSQSLSNITANNYAVTVNDANGCQNISNYAVMQPSEIQLTATVQNSNCGNSDGSISMSVTNGSSPFDYSWSTGDTVQNLNSLGAGSYIITVTDALGCSTSGVYSVTDLGAGSVTLSISEPSCYGSSDGVISASMTGGQSPFTYIWNNGNSGNLLVGLTSGNYSVDVTDGNGCIVSSSANLNQPAEIIIVLSVSNSNCGSTDGAVGTSITNGSSPFSYNWSNGSTVSSIANLVAGTYDLTVTDSDGCIQLTSAVVSDNGAGNLISNISNPSCSGASDGVISTVMTGGQSPYVYNWDNGSSSSLVVGLLAGSHSVTVSDGQGCLLYDNVTLIDPDTATYVISTMADTNSCSGSASVTITSGIFPYSYLWNDPNGQTNSIATALCNGNYSLQLTDGNGCDQLVFVNVADSTTYIPPSVSIAASSGCQADSLSFISSVTDGEAPFTYLWDFGDGNTSSDENPIYSYTSNGAFNVSLQITDATGTIAIDSESITINESPAAGFVSVPNNLTVLFQNNSSISLGTISSYLWTFGDGNLSTQTDPTYTYQVEGDYEVCLTATSDQGCVDTHCDSVSLNAVGIYNVNEGSSIKLTPNPARDFVRINFENLDQEEVNWHIINVQGQICAQGKLKQNQGNSQVLDLSSLSPGLYLFKAEGYENASMSRLIVE